MSGFSEDGQWWWNGHQWMASSQVVIPDIQISLPERLGRWLHHPTVTVWFDSHPIGVVLGLRQRFGGFREFRRWTLDQLAAATAHLLGPDEPMVAGETSMGRPPFWTTAYRDLAVVVTAGHVLVLRFDRYDGQPRWVALAAQARDAQVDAIGRVLPTVVVRHGTGKWSIRGMAGVMRPGAVADAWKAALGVPTKTRP